MTVNRQAVTARRFSRVLVANRGEIAVRIIQACAEHGLVSIAVYSDADADALHVRRADLAARIGPPPASQSYLDQGAIIAAALATRADAVHPGYGFLSENADFAQACIDARLVWIGPSPEAMRTMGSKIAAKRLAASLAIALLEGYDGAAQDPDTLAAEAERIGYPLLVKASAGGGGRGMRIVGMPSELPDALASAKRESLAAFGDDTLLLERYVARARHVEIQVFGDQYGTVLALGERECSIQRRHQKVIEEAPSPALTPSLRAAMSEAAVTLARAIDYTGAGTVEFLLDEDGRFAFLEMNTRLQVEHGVTELVTGIDLVDLQFRVTAGEPLPFSQEDVTLRGHAIECRIYAEDPAHGYLPSAGRLETFRPPDGPGIRNDVGVESGNVVSTYYDGMLAKLLVAGRTRADAIDRVALALRQYVVRGVTTNIPLLAATVDHRDFRAGKTFTSFLEEYEAGDSVQRVPPPEVLVASAVALANDGERGNPWQRGWRAAGEVHRVRICYGDGDAEIALTRTGPSEWSAGAGGETFTAVASGETVLVQHGATEQRIAVGRWGLEVAAVLDGAEWQTQPALLEMTRLAHADGFRGGTRAIKAPLTGVVVKVLAAEGDRVEAGQTIVVLDAMKMEHALAAPGSAVITRVAVQSGDLVQAGALLVELGDPPP